MKCRYVGGKYMHFVTANTYHAISTYNRIDKKIGAKLIKDTCHVACSRKPRVLQKLAPRNPRTAIQERSFLTQAHNRPNKYNAENNLLCMNARIERAKNSENLGLRIEENGALDQKIWALESFRGKMVFLGGSEEFLEFLKWWEGLWPKRQGSCGIWEIFRDFCGIFDGLEWFRTYS
jgi:hypothetical protein